MEKCEELLLDALRCAIHDETLNWTEGTDSHTRREVARLAQSQGILPLLMQSVWDGSSSFGEGERNPLIRIARKQTLTQAAHTASFLMLLEELSQRDVRPVVLKGLICRELYPQPEQRSSMDEDLLIAPEDFPRCHDAMLACGMKLLKDYDSLEKEEEVTYVDPERDLYVELHKRPFSAETEALSPCNELFSGALERRIRMEIYGCRVDTLHPTDHLLYMLCHAYKHLLFGGVGIRQICDICLFARRYAAEIDWDRVRSSCESIGIQILSAAFFLIGERHLDLPVPEAFADLKPDELPLLSDSLSGGLFGVDDMDRLHSSRITLDAAAADKKDRRRRGLIASVFPSRAYMADSYPYLKDKPWLLPAAWGQRLFSYLSQERGNPSRSMKIGRERVEMLKRYKVITEK